TAEAPALTTEKETTASPLSTSTKIPAEHLQTVVSSRTSLADSTVQLSEVTSFDDSVALAGRSAAALTNPSTGSGQASSTGSEHAPQAKWDESSAPAPMQAGVRQDQPDPVTSDPVAKVTPESLNHADAREEDR